MIAVPPMGGQFMTNIDEEIPFIDNPAAPDVFASEVPGFFVHAGVVRITLASARVNHATNPGKISRVVIGHLVLPIPAAQSLAVGLYNFLKEKGYDPAPKAPSETVQ